MKKIFFITIITAIIVNIFLGCKNSAKATEPSAAPTATATPFIKLDDFEDNNNISLIPCSDCTNSSSLWINPGAAFILTGTNNLGLAAANGNYYYSITGTTKKDGSCYIGFKIHTRTESAPEGTDMTGLNRLTFDYRYKGEPGARLYVAVANAKAGKSMYTSPNLDIVNDNAWHTMSIEFSSLTNFPASEVLPDVDNISFGIQSTDSSAPADDTHVEFSIDNIVAIY